MSNGIFEGVLDPNSDLGDLGGESDLPLNVHSNALANALIVKSGPGILYGFTVFNNKVSGQFVQVFDSQGLPADGAVPACVFTVATVANLGVNWIPGRAFLYGCVLVNSSTVATKTIGSADCFFDAQFI